jgi:hypothetical protein
MLLSQTKFNGKTGFKASVKMVYLPLSAGGLAAGPGGPG